MTLGFCSLNLIHKMGYVAQQEVQSHMLTGARQLYQMNEVELIEMIPREKPGLGQRHSLLSSNQCGRSDYSTLQKTEIRNCQIGAWGWGGREEIHISFPTSHKNLKQTESKKNT